ncbi:MAG TPA: abscisic acid-deficient protein Aba4 family protein [Allosphingosinicella sp.]|nr:abscisic acid-deficient protein Aba4 family protein [Allosphingosinicella sp.]
MNQIFWLAHVPAAIGWLALLLPVGSFRARRRTAMFCGAAAALVYTGAFFASPEAAVLIRDYSLTGVAAFFDVPHLQLAGWTHYLVLDLWAGIWEADEADRAGMDRRLLVPCLLTTAMIGPVGLLLFLVCATLARGRAGRGSRTSADGAGPLGQ